MPTVTHTYSSVVTFLKDVGSIPAWCFLKFCTFMSRGQHVTHLARWPPNWRMGTCCSLLVYVTLCPPKCTKIHQRWGHNITIYWAHTTNPLMIFEGVKCLKDASFGGHNMQGDAASGGCIMRIELLGDASLMHLKSPIYLKSLLLFPSTLREV